MPKHKRKCPHAVRMQFIDENGNTLFEVPPAAIDHDVTLRELAASAFDKGYELHFQLVEGDDPRKNKPVR